MSKLKNVRVLTTCAVLLALAAILGFLKVPVTPLIEIRFGSLPIAVAGALFGPVAGCIVGGLSDIVQFIVKPTGAYFPGFTISSAISGIIFGLILKPCKSGVRIWRIIFAEILYTVVVCIFINSLNLYILLGKMSDQGIAGYYGYIVTRLPKEIIMFPINCILTTIVIKTAYMIKKRITT